jgi:hypothetical protein
MPVHIAAPPTAECREMSSLLTREAREAEGAHLSPRQLTAIDRLLAGETVTLAAAAAGVCRETVCRWRRHDLQFIAALESRRAELREAVRSRLLSIAHRALENVARAVDQGDVRTSLIVLRGTGLLAGAPVLDSLGREEVALIADQLGGIIARHVTDPDLLMKIEAEIRTVGGCHGSSAVSFGS